MLKKSGSFMMARGVELWGRGGFMLKESGGFVMAQIKTKLLRFGPGRAHHCGAFLGGCMSGFTSAAPLFHCLKPCSHPAFPCPVRSDPAKRIARKNGPLS